MTLEGVGSRRTTLPFCDPTASLLPIKRGGQEKAQVEPPQEQVPRGTRPIRNALRIRKVQMGMGQNSTTQEPQVIRVCLSTSQVSVLGLPYFRPTSTAWDGKGVGSHLDGSEALSGAPNLRAPKFARWRSWLPMVQQCSLPSGDTVL